MKWNMGWMHDTLSYMEKDPIYRHYHHDLLTFGLLYAFTENFVLPFSHDEVVHGKKSMLDKMPGDAWQKFASLRLLYSFMFTYPGQEAAVPGLRVRPGQGMELRRRGRLVSAGAPAAPGHQADRRRPQPALSRAAGTARDRLRQQRLRVDRLPRQQPVGAELSAQVQADGKQIVACAFNFTPVPRENYRIGVPKAGFYREAINSDAELYGGSNVGNRGGVHSEPVSWMGRPNSIPMALPPLAGVVMVLIQRGSRCRR
jgi:1,4-alpha-glucan branching enzyme